MNKNAQVQSTVASGGAFHIENVYPIIDGGRFGIKRIVGEPIEVWADIYRMVTRSSPLLWYGGASRIANGSARR